MAFRQYFSWLILAFVAVLPAGAQTVVRAGITGPAWTASMSCPTGQYVTASPDDLHVFRAINNVSGTAGTTQPNWITSSQGITTDGTCQWAEWGTSGSTGNSAGGGSGSTPQTLPNCTATGGMVAMLGFQFATQTVGGVSQLCGTLATASSTVVEGICQTACGPSGTATVVYNGVTAGILDGTGQANDYVIPSSTPGYLTDVGVSRPSGTTETVGIIALPNSGGNGTAAQIFVSPLSLFAPGSSSGGGTINNAAQFRLPYYSSPGSTNILSGDNAATTDSNANFTLHSLKINGGGTGAITWGNGASPGAPASGNSTTFTDTATGNFHCLNSSGTDCSGTSVDVRVGYGGSGGVDCTGTNDSTSILQAMINNAPDFTKFVFPANCKVLVSTTGGAPKAITIQGRYGLEFWSEGHNTNACDTGSVGAGGMRIIDNSSYVSGATIFYINQSQRLLFHNLVVDIGGAADIGFDVDQTTSPPITTQNIWENVCVRNNVARNASFRGWRFSNTATSNVESQWLFSPYVQCSSQAATSQSSNGYGILFGNNINQKNEIVDKLGTFGCSVDVNAQNGTDFTFSNWLMSNSWTNLIDGTSNSHLSGSRTENATSAINLTNINAQHIISHNDLAGTTLPINCSPNGCGSIVVFGNSLDTLGDLFNPAVNGQNSTLVGFSNRNSSYNQYDFEAGMLTTPVTGACNFCYVTNTFGEYLTSPLRATPTSGTNNNNQSPVIILEGVYGASNTLDSWAMQSIPNGAYGNITNSTFEIEPISYAAGGMPPSGITRWLAFPGQLSGITYAPISTPSAPAISNGGTPATTTYTYCVVAHANTGNTPCSSTGTIAIGPSTLSATNYLLISWASVAGATSYDVYRTACGGGGICNTNPTGLIISHAGVIPEHWLKSQASLVTVYDTGLSGNAAATPTVNNTGFIALPNGVLISPVAPLIASGFGGTPSIVHSNGTAVFEVNVGSGGSATSGVITMPAATNGWSCQVSDMTTPSKVTTETAFNTTSITLTASAAWGSGDNLLVNCGGF